MDRRCNNHEHVPHARAPRYLFCLRRTGRSARPREHSGSALAYFLNPLLIDGQRAWADYTAGGLATFETVKWLQVQSAPDRKVFLDTLDRVGVFWDLTRRAEWALERQGPIRTNEDAWRVVKTAPSIDPFGERMKHEVLCRLFELAARK